MDKNQQELTFDESMKEVMRSLPPVVRSYLSQGKYTPVAKGLMTKHGLRIDQGGVLEREIMLLLMGVESPEEFKQSLTEEARISEETVEAITEDVNTQIFVPLREEEMKESVAEKEVVQSALAAAESHAAEEVPRAIHHELPQVVRKVPVVPAIEVPASAPVASVPKPLQSLPRIIVPIPTTPPRSPEPRPVFPAPQATSESPMPTVPSTTIKSYSVDPYREPIE